jgi:hypothetical protein
VSVRARAAGASSMLRTSGEADPFIEGATRCHAALRGAIGASLYPWRTAMNVATKTIKTLAAALGALCLSAPLVAMAGGEPCRVKSLKGLYVFSATGYTRANLDSPWVPKAIVEFLDLNGDGTLTTPWVTIANPFGNTGLIVDRVGNPGVYSVDDNCTGKIEFADGNVFRIFATPRGDEFQMIQTVGLGGSLNVFQGNVKRVSK